MAEPLTARDVLAVVADRLAPVDLAQIREMLELTPEERLLRVQEFVESAFEIQGLNEERSVR
jgi:hypothetical protein